jgi:hypothetical protein
MNDTERQRLVADAILLERAERVLARRYPDHFLLVAGVRSGLSEMARMWRDQAQERETLTEFLTRTKRPPDPLDTDESRAAFLDAVLKEPG